MSDEFDAVVERVRERVTPDDDERERLGRAVAELRERTREALADLPVDAEIVQVGSTARDTWLAGDRDVDLFVSFPTSVAREDLESYGLDIGHAVLPDGHEEFAEHPYVKGTYEGFDVDLVPCYAVADATRIQSAVDRTPFHTEYLAERIDADLAGEVRVAKQFLTGIGVYGSDLRTRGFSGFLTELLVHEYGGFRPLVETAAAEWHPPVEFDPEGHAAETFDDPLVVIDPTDPERNVAAVCSAEAVARLQHYARDLVADPREDLFVPHEPEPIDADAVVAAFERRATTPVAVRFDAPDIVDDQLYPQLDRSLAGLVGELDRRGFDVLRSAAWADETVALFAELEVAERPAVERHEGPPVGVRDHAEGFFQAYADEDAAPDDGPGTYGPFLDGDRYVVERPREFETSVGLLESDAVFDVALGAQVETAMNEEYAVLSGEEVGVLADEFGVELARYLDPRP
ncbi:tRNA CCA-pyrophosphorylase [Halosimplex carlsbadense 2-9-1]|uniref:CCA-adding enzyme n=1 Tax=Halosimplex carlsbadense 2-9-1 TaxID=797114 RepID=M0D0F0_9EURY|nr:CCA tRNA nucleotidyltransferase [Halosimplex carlsbadense]ELZ27614.1 tRNA CCA-pyrophosphorylase [Halosimplex carlsbadense 2-9-1]